LLYLVVKTPSLPPPSTAPIVNDTAIGAFESIPSSPPSTTTAIAAIDGHHCRCHTVDNNDHHKPADVVCRRQWERWSLLTEEAVDGDCDNDGLCQWRLSSKGKGRVMRARMVVIVVISGGKDTIVAAAINCRHSQRPRHWSCQINPIVAAVDNDRYRCCQQPPLPLPHS
jgi:hypothetical protein